MFKDCPNIIFDFGGVIINIDYDAPVRAFAELTDLNFRDLFTQAGQNPIFDLHDTGRMSSAAFRAEVKKLIGRPDLSDEVFDDAWNSILGKVPSERVRLLKTLAKTRRIFLLSNTNPIHAAVFLQEFESDYGQSLHSLFERVYLSHEIRDQKPNLSIYQTVMAQNDLNPAETLFIDDSVQHVRAAQEVGLYAHHLQSPQTILDLAWTGI